MESQHLQLDQDSLDASLTDWIYLGRFVGYRSVEWNQVTQKEYLKIDHPNWTEFNSYAFTAEDFLFYNDQRQLIQNIADAPLDHITFVTIRFCKQKNNVNGEIIPYYKDMANPAFCPVNTALNITKRVHHLQSPPEEPIGTRG